MINKHNKKRFSDWVFQIEEDARFAVWLSEGIERSEWEQLFREATSAPSFLSPGFAETWFRHYSKDWMPLLVIARDSAGCLRGLLPLAIHDRFITGVGAHQAEYQGWLSQPGDSADFIDGAIATLFRSFSRHRLQLRYLLPGPNADAARRIAAQKANILLTSHHRPLMRLTSQQIETALKKKSNKSKFNRLARQGELIFRHVTEPNQLNEIIDDITMLYDFRQGAINNSCPFLEDPHKKNFHLDWFRTAPEHFHISCFLIDGRVVAALIGVNNGQETGVAIQAFSALHARHSPGKLNLYKAAEILADGRQATLDMTPGGDWKDRFATDTDEVLELTAYARANDARRVLYQNRFSRAAKRLISTGGIEPTRVKAGVRRLRRLNAANAVKQVGRLLPKKTEYLVYQLPLEQHDTAHAVSAPVQINALDALIRFKPIYPWQSRQRFLSQALARLESGTRAYTIRIEDELLHCGWLAVEQTSSFFTEVGRHYTYPEPGAVLFDFFTAPGARNRGYYQATIMQMLADLKQREMASTAYISVLADNAPSRYVIEKIGFKPIAALFRTRIFGYDLR